MNWIKLTDRLPELGVLVYTRHANGKVSAYTRHAQGWNTKLARTEESPIVEWLDEEN